MHIRPLTLAASLALLRIASADPEFELEERSIYVPQQIKRDFFNASAFPTDSTTSDSDFAAPSARPEDKISAPTTERRQETSTTRRPGGGLFEPTSDAGDDFFSRPSSIFGGGSSGGSQRTSTGLTLSDFIPDFLRPKPDTTSTTSTDQSSGRTRAPTGRTGETGSKTEVSDATRPTNKPGTTTGTTDFTRPFNRPESSRFTQPETTRGDASRLSSTSDNAIVIAPTGVVTPSSQSPTKDATDRVPTSNPLRPSSPDSGSLATVPSTNSYPSADKTSAMSTSNSGILEPIVTVPSTVPIPSSRSGSSDFIGTGSSSNPQRASSAETATPTLLNPIVDPVSSVLTAPSPILSNVLSGSAPIVSTVLSAPTSKAGAPEPVNVSSTTPASDSPYSTASRLPTDIPPTNNVPTPTSKSLGSESILPVLSSVVSVPTLINSTAVATESTIPPPIAVLPTGSSPLSILPTVTSVLSSAKSTPQETSLSQPTPDLLPSISSLLSTISPTSILSVSPDQPLNTTIGAIPITTSLSSLIPTDTATVPTSDRFPEIPIGNSTSILPVPVESTSVGDASSTYSSLPTGPATVPAVNGTTSVESTSLPTGPATLEPTNALPPASNSTSARPTSSRPQSEPTLIPVVPTSTRPATSRIGSATLVTSPSVRPSTSVAETASQPSSLAAPPSSTASPTPAPSSTASPQPPPQPTTATAPQPFPTGIPKYIAPSKPNQAPPPPDTVNITIGFRDVVSRQYPDDGTVKMFQKIFDFLPRILALSYNSTNTGQIQVYRMEVCNDQPQWGSAIALVSFPNGKDMIDKLQMDLRLPNSPISMAEKEPDVDPNEKLVIDKIDKTYDIRSKHCSGGGVGGSGGNGGGAVPGSSPGSNGGANGNGDKPNTDSFGNPVNNDNPSRQQAVKTGGIVAGAVAASAAYGVVMFLLARRYKRKRQSHRRSSSVTDSQDSSEMRYNGTGSPALMGGALVSRDQFSYGAGGRDSRGSGPSGMGNSGRTANISAPVAAENSLGWN